VSTITTQDGTQIDYKDWGTGQPVVFSHGWPLSADAWEDQMLSLASRGYRCIATIGAVTADRVSPGTETTWTPTPTTSPRWSAPSTGRPPSTWGTPPAAAGGPVTSVATARAGSPGLKVYPGAPHGMCSTHKDEINADLLGFLKAASSREPR
jgi:hypothetical protein